jgi:hypothetical protein
MSVVRLWDPDTPLPPPGAVPFLDEVRHVMVQRAAAGEYQFLHESSVTFHGDELVVAFANDPRDENSAEGIVRATRSRDDGRTWSAPEIVTPGNAAGRECDNHVLLHSHGGVLRAYAARWRGGVQPDGTWCPLPSMRTLIFAYDAKARAWRETGTSIPQFLPMQAPQRTPNGGWIVAGEFGFEQSAVALCADDGFSTWTTVAIPLPARARFPEPTIIVEPDCMTAIIRNEFMMGPPQRHALVAESRDHGRTWSKAVESNLPMVASKPFGGVLSTGQRYLVFNYPDPHCRRGCLAVAVSRPGEKTFSRLRAIRHGVPPVRLPGLCKDAQWSYPFAVEHGGNLYVSYSISKEDCALSVIPLSNFDSDRRN